MSCPQTCPECGYDLKRLSGMVIGPLRVMGDGSGFVWRNAKVKLTRSEQLITLAIIRAGGHPIKIGALAEAAGSNESSDPKNLVCVFLHRIKAAFIKIDPKFDEIKNVRGYGYCWRTLESELYAA